MISTIFGTWTLSGPASASASASVDFCTNAWYGYPVQLLENMHNCTSLKSVMFKKQLILLAMSLTQPWHLFKDNVQ